MVKSFLLISNFKLINIRPFSVKNYYTMLIEGLKNSQGRITVFVRKNQYLKLINHVGGVLEFELRISHFKDGLYSFHLKSFK